MKLPKSLAAVATVALLLSSSSNVTNAQDLGGPIPVTSAAAPPLSAEASFFYDQLAPYGQWMWIDPYGWVWSPNNVAVGWRPYTDGHWVYSDAGWTWASDQPWGWAAFHYGRWFFEANRGWCWVPGSEWAPAWVAWHWGDDYCGWAALPPVIDWQSRSSWDAVIPNFGWCFVPRRNFYDRHLVGEIALVARNVTFLGVTREVTHFERRGNVIVNLSLTPELVEKAVGRSVRRLEIAEVNSLGAVGAHVKGSSAIAIYRPLVRETRVITPLPHVQITPAEVTFEKLQRDEVAHRELEAQQAREKEKLEKIHATELRNPPPGISAPELMQRQQAEHNEFNNHVARQTQVLEQRQKSSPPPTASQRSNSNRRDER
jgi:hypothetical protein